MTNPKLKPLPKRAPMPPRAIEEPSKIVEGMVQDVSGAFRGRYRQTKAAKLRNYADAGQITEEQLLAGEWYERNYKLRERAGQDSTDLDRIRGGFNSAPVTETQSDAIKKIISVDSRLPLHDRQIVRMVCGEGHNASEAVFHITNQNVKAFAIPRFREAMDKLVTAIARAQRGGWRFIIETIDS